MSGTQQLRTCSLAPPTTTRWTVSPRPPPVTPPLLPPLSPQVLLWDVSQVGAVLSRPLRVVLRPVYHRYPSEALLLSASFNADGSRLVVASKDRRVRVLDPRTGKILQVRLGGSDPSGRSAPAQAAPVLAGVALQMPPGPQGSVRELQDAPVHREFSLEPPPAHPLGPRRATTGPLSPHPWF